ncbi:MAG: phosphoribosylanthranilate isomerase [Syntrophomonadaceae bacterium]|nr:phosphoribosylanthranilate isomerase [Syntrophomonadaceae bacterium]
MTRIMICGARHTHDIELLVEAGVDAIGLITEVRQRIVCNLARERAREFSRMVPPEVAKVLIVTAEAGEEIIRMAEYVEPDVIQLHGFNKPEDGRFLKERLPFKIVKTLHVYDRLPEKREILYEVGQAWIEAGVDALLLDSCHEDKVGSTGRTLDFSWARSMRDRFFPVPLVLAGGLCAANAAEAVKTVQPYGIDVFSGVNTGGFIDPVKLEALVGVVRKCQ